MSGTAREWAHRAGRRAGRTAQLVLRELARAADVDGGVVIAIGTLATAAACSPRQASRAVRELEELGLVKVQAMPGTVSMYTLAIDAGGEGP